MSVGTDKQTHTHLWSGRWEEGRRGGRRAVWRVLGEVGGAREEGRGGGWRGGGGADQVLMTNVYPYDKEVVGGRRGGVDGDRGEGRGEKGDLIADEHHPGR